MPSWLMPMLLAWEAWWDYIINLPIAPLVFYPLVSAAKMYFYWSEYVFIGGSSYAYAMIDCLYATFFQALHGTMNYAAQYTLRIGDALRPGEYDFLLDAAWSMLVWYTYPFRKDIVVWKVDYVPFRVLENSLYWWCTAKHNPKFNENLPWKVIAFGPAQKERVNMNLTLGNTAANQDFKINLEFPFGMFLLVDGYPDTRCAFYTYPFWTATFGYHIPTCWALSIYMIIQLVNREPISRVYLYILRSLKKFGIDVDKLDEDDRTIEYSYPNCILRICCAYKDRDFSWKYDKPSYYAWIAARPTPMCTHFLNTSLEDMAISINDSVSVLGETIKEIISWFKSMGR